MPDPAPTIAGALAVLHNARTDALHQRSVYVDIRERATRRLDDIGHRLWLYNLTGDRQTSNNSAAQLQQLPKTDSSSGTTVFDSVFVDTLTGDRKRESDSQSNDALFMSLALDELRRTAAQLRPICEATDGQDGWVSMEVSPLLADDTTGTFEAATGIFRQAGCPNLFIKIPGTPAGIAAIEECIFEGIPVDITMLFSREQYLAAAGAYYRGITRRLRLGLDPKIPSIASVFANRWDKAIGDSLPLRLHHRLGIAMSGRIHHTYLDVLASRRWSELTDKGARSQRLMWAMTDGNTDGPDTIYMEAAAAPQAIVAMPEDTLQAFADHRPDTGEIEPDGRQAEPLGEQFALAGVNLDALATHLQRDCLNSSVMSWHRLMARLSALRAQGTCGGPTSQ